LTGSSTSDVWASFGKLELDSDRIDFVKCLTCETVLRWKSKDGTSGIKAHLKSCRPTNIINPKLTDVAGFTVERSSALPAELKNGVTELIVRMCATDIRYLLILFCECIITHDK